LGLIDASARAIRVSHYQEFLCAGYSGLDAILKEFLGNLAGFDIQDLVIGLPGYALNGAVINRNLPWRVAIAELREQLSIPSISWLNDFAALAHSIPWIDPQQATTVCAGDGEVSDAPILIVGPGTGLGAAISITDSGRHKVLATEAGQAAFAPQSDMEIEILRFLRRTNAHVSVEMLISGPGLLNLYNALCAIQGATPQCHTPIDITHAADAGTDAIATQAIRLFCAILGGVVGGLVMSSGAQGGVYLAGGVLPKISAHLLKSDFRERFIGNSVMRCVLERVPVRLIDHGQLGVIGAASWFFDQRREARV
jgi:glucokinase